MHSDQTTHRSGTWLLWVASVCWLAGAGGCAAWIFESGGVVWPIASFAVWTVGLFLFVICTLPKRLGGTPKVAALTEALRFGGYSVVALLLGILFVQYWPVTLSMTVMFAICRGMEMEDDDVPAYGALPRVMAHESL